MNLPARFLQYIDKHRLVAPGERTLLAVSGGVDSVALACLFHECRLPFGIAHVNFQLRAAESDGDEDFVRELAENWEVPFFSKKMNTAGYAADNGLSVQMAARELRYTWFEEIRTAHQFSGLATGHHANDSVETALLHFIRGTGLSGLGGIPVRNGPVIRPLLFASRQEILDYARERQISWREDSSNATDTYTRNAVRLRVLPRIQEINPAFLDSATQTLRQLRAADANLQFLLHRFLGEPDAAGVRHLDKKALAELPALADALFDLLQFAGFTADQVRQMADNWGQTGMEWQTPAGYRLLNDRRELLLFPVKPAGEFVRIDEDDLLVSLPEGGRLLLSPTAAGGPWPEAAEEVIVDAAKLQFPLLLRRWQTGDVFQPLGMAGKSQKLQDFFTNRKLSVLEKEKTWLLVNGDHTIIWVVGMRLDERFKIREETFKLLKICWIKPL